MKFSSALQIALRNGFTLPYIFETGPIADPQITADVKMTTPSQLIFPEVRLLVSLYSIGKSLIDSINLLMLP